MSKEDVAQGIREKLLTRRKARQGDIVLQKDLTQQQDRQRIEEMERAEKARMLEFGAERQPALAEIKPEHLEHEELNKIINDFEAKQSQIAETRAQKTGRFASLAKSLGIKTRNLENDEEIVNLEKESHDLYRSLLAKGINLYKGDKPQLENFLRQFDEFEVFKGTYNQEIDKRAEVAGFPENILAGLHTLTKKWSELKTWQKIAISAGGGLLFAGGAAALGAGTFGAATLTAGWRWGFRGFGAAAAGIGRNVMLDRKMMSEMENESEAWLKEKMSTLEKYENNLDQGIEDILSKTGIKYIRKDFKQRRLENNHRAIKFALKTFIISSAIGESLRLGGQYTGINLGSILKKIGGFAGISGSVSPEVSKGSLSEELYIRRPDGKIIITPKGLEAIGDAPPKFVTEPEVKTGGTMEEFAKSPAAGAEVHASEIAKPQFEEIASVKVKAGGTMWGSIENNIRANPSAYGLDPRDPDFTKDMHRMTKQMLDEFASRKGLSYEQLDQMARTKVRAGDTFKIIHDPSAGDLYLDDYHGKAFGADVAQVDSPVQEVEISKPKVAPEELRTKTGPAEYPAQKSASQIRGMEELDANQRLAQQKYARAVQAEKDLAILHERQAAHLKNVGREAHLRQVLATRGLLNRIVEGAGIGNNVSFWEGSALEWHDQIVGKENYIPQDVQMADEVKKLNLNLGRLRELFLKLGKPELGQSMGDYLKKAMENPKNVYIISRLILRK